MTDFLTQLTYYGVLITSQSKNLNNIALLFHAVVVVVVIQFDISNNI